MRGYPAAVVQAELPEAALIQQYCQSSLPSVVNSTPQLGNEDLRALSAHPLPDTLAALSRAGIILTTPEFIKLFIEKVAPGTQIPPEVLDNLTALQSEFLDMFSKQPSLLNDLMGTLTVEEPQQQELIQKTIAPML